MPVSRELIFFSNILIGWIIWAPLGSRQEIPSLYEFNKTFGNPDKFKPHCGVLTTCNFSEENISAYNRT